MRVRAFQAAVFILLFASGCTNKELYYAGEPVTVSVRFDWSHAPDASPAGMTLYFFPLSDDGEIWRFDIAGAQGGPVSIPCGDYRLVVCNNDLPDIYLEDTGSFLNIRAVARKPEKDNMVRSPGNLYSGAVEFVSVTPLGVSYSLPDNTGHPAFDREIVCYPSPRTARYTISIVNVEGMDDAGSVTCILDGIASGVTLAEGLPYGVPSAMECTLTPDLESRRLDGQMLAFPGLPREYPYILKITAPDKKLLESRKDLPMAVKSSNFEVLLTVGAGDICLELPEILREATNS